MTTKLILADFNGDGLVDFRDFSLLASAWLTIPEDDGWDLTCNIAYPYDNTIDESDLTVLAENWLQ